MNASWDVQPTEHFRKSLIRYYDLETCAPKVQSERELEVRLPSDESDLAAFVRFAQRLRQVTDKLLDPGSLPSYNRHGKQLPSVKELREEPWTAFYVLRKARTQEEQDVWFGLHVFHDADILENSITHTLTIINDEIKNA